MAARPLVGLEDKSLYIPSVAGLEEADLTETDLKNSDFNSSSVTVEDLPLTEPVTEEKKIPVIDDEDQPPDGGLQAWTIVASSFLIHFLCWGNAYSWGVYQRYLVSNGLYGNTVSLAALGSSQTGVIFLLGMPIGIMTSRYGFRRLIQIGAVCFGSGYIFASFGTEYWHLFLSQGVLAPIGIALCFFPSITIASQWFTTKRAIATGIAVSGTGLGGLVYSVMIEAMLEKLGFQWTIRIVGIYSVVLLLLVSMLIKQRTARTTTLKVNWAYFKDYRIWLFLLQSAFGSLAFQIPIVYLSQFAGSLGENPAQGAFVILIFNLAGMIGRVALGFAADSLGRLNTVVFCTLFTGFSTLFIWSFTYSYGLLLVYAFCEGIGVGGFVSVVPPAIVELWGFQDLPFLFGVINFPAGIATFVGAPIAGLILTQTQGQFSNPYLGVILFAGCFMSASGFTSLAIRLTRSTKLFARV
ncbi:hypothetical protein SmJEL517_g04991 [Synchytrium microbalum]|uniref:Major facilitator superfamily (MFS) profile domain-containing protein n=1 Tax=Synchytrium microbalum TaxID=1806994 RepID=A0A507C2M7_9FUNG|nr:uncharacterized protein SmJEL517_g04991 [Synchytrium microbalum]TPX31763.1 hypothetical protein SmJEL517_g04991 [Synchytrium microbalum]